MLDYCSSNIYAPIFRSPIENKVFSAYCKHQQEYEDIIRQIAEGDTDITLDDDFSQNELEYIEKRLREDYGIYATLTIS